MKKTETIEIVYCDVCKKLITGGYIDINNIRLSDDTSFSVIYSFITNKNGSRKLDLCPECMEGLRSFFETRRRSLNEGRN